MTAFQKKKKQMRRIVSSSWRFLLAATAGMSQAQPTPDNVVNDYQCNFYQDTCRYDWQMDEHCDSDDDPQGSSSSCVGGDCWDCDPCQAWNYKCGSCIEAGCHWCPGDGLCLSQALEERFWTQQQQQHRVTSCPTAQDWILTCDSPTENNVYSDTAYSAMKWIYEMIRVEEVWRQGITGTGVKVRVNDDGVDPWHPELIGRFDLDNSCTDVYQPQDPEQDVHGTAVASIVGADNNNGCSVGIAPDVKISSCNLRSLQDAAYVFQSQLKEGIEVDISINPWTAESCTYRGETTTDRQPQQECPFDANHPATPCLACTAAEFATQPTTPQCQQAIATYCRQEHTSSPASTTQFDKACYDYLEWFVQCEYHSLDADTHDMLIRNIVWGRQQKGIVFVVPAGDLQQLGGNGNLDGFVHSRFTIAVAAVDKQGMVASYSTPGSPILISAPGGDYQYITNNVVAKPAGGCRDAGPGTSYAVPVVGGVVALMLEVNPDLGWRDVQAILIKTAQQVDKNGGDEWTTNAAGYAHSYHYGFGIVNAAKAVNAAKTWKNYPKEEQIMVETSFSDGSSQVIVDSANNVTSSKLKVEGISELFRIESVVVYVDLQHGSRGDLKITLTSPGGTESLLAPSKRPENSLQVPEKELWKFLTVRNFGENPSGEWELTIVDERPGVLEQCVDNDWQYTYNTGGSTQQTVTCFDFYLVNDCTNEAEVDPVLWEAEYEGQTMFDSCCKCGGGDNRQNMTNVLNGWNMVIYGHLGSETDLNIPPSTCQFTNDTCPMTQQFDHVCDDTLLNEECIGGDCFDCDPCQVFSYDCKACVQAGCNFCPGDGTCMSVSLDQSFWELYPVKTTTCPTSDDWKTTCDAIRSENSFDDPLYDAMRWSYEMINIEPVWNDNSRGNGVHVRINDDGVDAEHPEFVNNFDEENSCTNYLPLDYDWDTHGTAVASIVAGNNNNECAVGIAPGATISSCVGPTTLDDAPEMFLSKLDNVDISVNSWSPSVCHLTNNGMRRRLQQCIFPSTHPDSPCEICGDFPNVTDECETAVSRYCTVNYEDDQVACSEYLDLFVSCRYHLLPLDAHESFVKAITDGRGGKGVIFVFSAGNRNRRGADTNFNGFINSRYTIAVGSVGKDRRHASYSTTGAGVFVSAPGGDFESVSGNMVANPGGGCHDIGVGTSFATPVVAGVVAHLLEANPMLTWRDVQGILALTSQRIDPDSPSWVTNAAGNHHSYQYGFGLVNAQDAVNRAKDWETLGDEKQHMMASGPLNLGIADNDDSGSPGITTSTLTFSLEKTLQEDFVMESVVVYLDLQHPSRGDLLIVLTSPGGTESILHPGKRPENSQLEIDTTSDDDDYQKWKLLSLRTWGESPTGGDWTLTIQDLKPGNFRECVDLPWQYRYPRGDGNDGYETLTCPDVALVTDCKDSEQLNQAALSILYQNRTLLESCCACGGGQPSPKVSPILRSWKLIVYGHNHILEPPPPSAAAEEPMTTGPQTRPDTTTNDPPATEEQSTQNHDAAATDTDRVDVTTNNVEDDSIWDDGNSGVFSGGGGTAYWSEGWRGKNEEYPLDDVATSGVENVQFSHPLMIGVTVLVVVMVANQIQQE